MRLIDLTGKRFTRLVALCREGTQVQPSGQARPMWVCRCDCGAMVSVRGSDLRSGNTKGCGNHKVAPNKTHGKSGGKSAAFSRWCGMRNRCNNTNSPQYADYGGRGITVCERWNDFVNFLADMGEPPASEMQIERRDNSGPYSPENCYWATRTQQARNRRSNITITANGETMCLKAWCERLGRNYPRVHARIMKLGWDPLTALEITT